MSTILPRASRSCLSGLDFENRTTLDGDRLRRMLVDPIAEWPLDGVTVRVRYGRGADFSGRCHYQRERIYVNLGRHLRFPYRLNTYLARAVAGHRSWHRPVYTMEIANGYELALFIFLHEWYHLLVKRARRNPRQKESMCDRFAARVLVDRYGAIVRDAGRRPVPRAAWDFQDLDGFVRRARRRLAGGSRSGHPPAPGPVSPSTPASQLLLFQV